MKIDLHCHTIFSDGIDTPERMVARAKAVGLDGIAITDHDTIAGWKRAIDAGKRLGCVVIPGKEMKIRNGKTVVGELLALFINEDIKINQVVALEEIIDKIREQDGVAAVPHPFDWFRKSSLIDIIEHDDIKIDAIESINGRNRGVSNAKGIEYAQKNKIPQIAGSDAHCMEEVGMAYTFCEINKKSGNNSGNSNDDDGKKNKNKPYRFDCVDESEVESFRKAILKGKSKVIGMQRGFLSIFATRATCWVIRLGR